MITDDGTNMPIRTDASWWADALGVRRDPASAARWSRPVASDGMITRTCELTSFETTLIARLVLPVPTPEQASPDQVVVLPFYEVESLFGEPYARGAARSPEELAQRAYGRQLIQRGAGVLAVPWWCEVEATSGSGLVERYGGPADAHRRRWQESSAPVTGLGRAVGDLLSAVDALESLCEHGELEVSMITAFGHSLGGKLALVLTALDQRVRAAVIHELGLGFDHSNWADPWYLDDQIPEGHDLDELLALIAPRPCLYGGGAAFDGPDNRHLADSAVHQAGRSDWLRIVTHDNGHTPPTEFLEDSYRWLLDLRP